MRETLEKARSWIILDEGPYTNESTDPGGPTKYGITLYDYRDWFHKPEATAEDVRELSIEAALEIQTKRYWDPCSCSLLPIGVDYFTFDSAMLSGTGAAIRWLQRAVGATPDGSIGPKTLDALARDHPLDVVIKMEALRRQRLRSLSLWWQYGRGWTNRVNKAKSRASKLILADAELHASHPTPAVPAGDVTPTAAPIVAKLENARA